MRAEPSVRVPSCHTASGSGELAQASGTWSALEYALPGQLQTQPGATFPGKPSLRALLDLLGGGTLPGSFPLLCSGWMLREVGPCLSCILSAQKVLGEWLPSITLAFTLQRTELRPESGGVCPQPQVSMQGRCALRFPDSSQRCLKGKLLL